MQGGKYNFHRKYKSNTRRYFLSAQLASTYASIFNINKCIKPLFIKRTHVRRFAFSVSPGIDCRWPSAALCLREFSTAQRRRRVTERGGNPFYIVVDAEEYTTNRDEDFMEQAEAGDFFHGYEYCASSCESQNIVNSHSCVCSVIPMEDTNNKTKCCSIEKTDGYEANS